VRPVFQRIAVVGLGLLGGSVARAARERGGAAVVVGSTRREDVRARALRDGSVDAIAPVEQVARDAELVVLATPVHAMPDVLRRLAPSLAEGTIVTDVGSVKAPLVETLPGLLPPGVLYVGSHPMAGSHESGMLHARADLFEGAACVVTDAADAAAVDRLCRFWRALGARVVRRDAAAHDAEVAWVSHVPHALAFAFAHALAAAPSGAPELAGSGFRDFTRIAQSEAELWSDILTANRKALTAPLQAAQSALAELSRTIESGDAEALERVLGAARQTLLIASSRSPVAGPEARDETESPSPEAEKTERSTKTDS
jgi:prephenate dehydrogenase